MTDLPWPERTNNPRKRRVRTILLWIAAVILGFCLAGLVTLAVIWTIEFPRYAAGIAFFFVLLTFWAWVEDDA